MVRSQAMKEAQKRYRITHADKWRELSRKNMKKSYNEKKKLNKNKYYMLNRNYRGLDSIENYIRFLYVEDEEV
jgi:hypothetical protein